MPVLLHLGCGANRKVHTTAGFQGPAGEGLRFDIDPGRSV